MISHPVAESINVLVVGILPLELTIEEDRLFVFLDSKCRSELLRLLNPLVYEVQLWGKIFQSIKVMAPLCIAYYCSGHGKQFATISHLSRNF